MTSDQFLDGIVAWAGDEFPIRALLLEGSMAEPEGADDMSDYDINAFVTTHEPYTGTDEWMSGLGDVTVYVPALGTHNGEQYPTRLIIFRDGRKADFSFLSMSILESYRESLPDQYDAGYRVLLDKDGILEGLREPGYRAFRAGKPTEEEYLQCVREFWFEVYHVAKYLSRNDLWVAKFRDWSAKEHLLKMIEWNSRARNNWDYRTHPEGKRLHSWTDYRTWEELHRCFGRFDAKDSWEALLSTCRLFSVTARETSSLLECNYPVEIEEDIVFLANRLRQKFRDRES